MVDLVYREPGIIPRTLEDAEFLEQQRLRREAMAKGEWLPEGWEWIDQSHDDIPSDTTIEGAWHRQSNVVVYPIRRDPWPKIHKSEILIKVKRGVVRADVLQMVVQREWFKIVATWDQDE